MNRHETIKILAVLSTAYPRLDDDRTADRLHLWEQLFAEETYKLVNAAISTFISSDDKGYAPSPGQIKSICRRLSEPEQLTESEAVTLILRATKNGIYGSEEEFKKLPPMCQSIVVTPERLTDWAKLSEDEVNTVIASNLRRAYIAQVKRDEEIRALPNVAKTMLGSLKMIGGANE